MDENPYAAPETPQPRSRPRPRARFGFQNVVFSLLGAVFLLLPGWVIGLLLLEGRAVPIRFVVGLAVTVALGVTLFIHGLLRKRATIGAVIAAVVVFLLTVVIIAILETYPKPVVVGSGARISVWSTRTLGHRA